MIGQNFQRKPWFCFSPDLKTAAVLPSIDGINNLDKSFTEQPIRILISGCGADDRSALEMFLQNKPDLDVVAEAGDIPVLLTQAQATQPDVILLDWDLCDRPLEELITALHQLENQPGVIIINTTPESGQAALTAGADAFIVRGDPSKRMLVAIESIRLMREV